MWLGGGKPGVSGMSELQWQRRQKNESFYVREPWPLYVEERRVGWLEHGRMVVDTLPQRQDLRSRAFLVRADSRQFGSKAGVAGLSRRACAWWGTWLGLSLVEQPCVWSWPTWHCARSRMGCCAACSSVGRLGSRAAAELDMAPFLLCHGQCANRAFWTRRRRLALWQALCRSWLAIG